MHLTRVGVHACVRFHAEVPLVALLHVVHFQLTLAAAVLNRTGRSNQRGVDGRAVFEQQPFGGQCALTGPESAGRVGTPSADGESAGRSRDPEYARGPRRPARSRYTGRSNRASSKARPDRSDHMCRK